MSKAGINQDDSRTHNRELILKYIKQHPRITRANLANLSGLSKPAITKITNDLLSLDFIIEDKKGDSRNKGLIFREGIYFCVSLYLSRLSITGAIYDIAGNRVIKERLPKGITFYDNDNLIYDIKELIAILLKKSHISLNSILALGIAAPGGSSSKTGSGYFSASSVYSGAAEIPFNWNKIQLVEYLEETTGLPVFLEDNSNLCALAENWFGKGLDVKNFIQYSVGLGIGAGAILDGELVTGSRGISLEIGHTTVNLYGEKCFCGNRGCLETEAGFRKLVDMFYGYSTEYDSETTVSKTAEIFNRFSQEDPDAVKAVREHAYRIATGAVTLINLFGPEKLIISTNDAEDIPFHSIIKDIEYFIRKHVHPLFANALQIEYSGLGDDIHLLGAYALILRRLYSLILQKRRNDFKVTRSTDKACVKTSSQFRFE